MCRPVSRRLIDNILDNVSEAEVRRILDAEELQEIKDGRAGVHTTSQTAFLAAGLQLEIAQYVLRLANGCCSMYLLFCEGVGSWRTSRGRQLFL